jgi:hypothetical protein
LVGISVSGEWQIAAELPPVSESQTAQNGSQLALRLFNGVIKSAKYMKEAGPLTRSAEGVFSSRSISLF